MMIHMHPAQQRHTMHASAPAAASPSSAGSAATSPRSASLLHPSSAAHVPRSRSSSRRSSPSRSRNGSFGPSAGNLLLPIHLHPGSSSTCPISLVGLTPPPSPLKPFDPATASAKQLDLRAIDAHMRITIAALDKARDRFILQFSTLSCLSVLCLLHAVSSYLLDGSSSSSGSLLVLLACVVILLLYVATGTWHDRMNARATYVHACNRWLSLFGVQWEKMGAVATTAGTGAPSGAATASGAKAREGLVVEELPREEGITTPPPPRKVHSHRSASAVASASAAAAALAAQAAAAAANAGLSTQRGLNESMADYEARLRYGVESRWINESPAAARRTGLAVPSFTLAADTAIVPPVPLEAIQSGGPPSAVAPISLAAGDGASLDVALSPTALLAGVAVEPASLLTVESAVGTLIPPPSPGPIPAPLHLTALQLSPSPSNSPLASFPAGSPGPRTSAAAAAAVVTTFPGSASATASPRLSSRALAGSSHGASPSLSLRKLGDTRMIRSASTSALPVDASRSPLPLPRSSVSGFSTPRGAHRRSRSGLFGIPPRPPSDTRTLTPTDARFLRSSIFSPDLGPNEDLRALSPPTPTHAEAAAAAAAGGSPLSMMTPPKDERERMMQEINRRANATPDMQLVAATAAVAAATAPTPTPTQQQQPQS